MAGGVFAVVLGLFLLAAFPLDGVIVVAVGAVSSFLGRSLLAARQWARTVDVLLFFFGLLGYGFLLIFGGTLIAAGAFAGMGTNLVMMYYLTRPYVKEYFGQPSL